MADVEVARLIARLEADVRDFDRDLRKAEKRLDKLDTSTKRTAKQAGVLDKQIGATGMTMRTVFAGAAGAATLKFMNDSVRAASNLEEAINAVEKTYGPAAQGVLNLGRDAADAFGMSNRAFNEFAVRFSAFGQNIAQQSGRNIVSVVDEIAGRVADFASVHNLSLQEAQQVAQSTLAGETEVFRRFGGDVSAATVETKALELGLKGVGNELTEQEKQLVRYQLFMEQTTNTAGDFKDTQDQMANALRTFEADLENFQSKAGNLLLPWFTEVIQLGGDVISILDDLAAVIPGVSDSGELMGEVFNQALFGIPKIIDTIANDTGRLGDIIRSAGGIAGFQLNQMVDRTEDAELASANFGSQTRLLSNNLVDAADKAMLLGQGYGQLRNDTENVEDATDSARTSVRGMITDLRALRVQQVAMVDPVVSGVNALNNYKDALAASVEAIAEYKEGSDEANEAGLQLLESYANLVGEATALADATGTTAADAIRTLGQEAGLTETQIRDILAAMRELDGFAAEASLNVKVTGATSMQVGSQRVDPGEFIAQTPTRIFRQHGGPVTANNPFIVGERGPELFVPNTSGQIIPELPAMTSGPTTIFNTEMTFERVEGDNIDEDIQRGLLLSDVGQYAEVRN